MKLDELLNEVSKIPTESKKPSGTDHIKIELEPLVLFINNRLGTRMIFGRWEVYTGNPLTDIFNTQKYWGFKCNEIKKKSFLLEHGYRIEFGITDYRDYYVWYHNVEKSPYNLHEYYKTFEELVISLTERLKVDLNL